MVGTPRLACLSLAMAASLTGCTANRTKEAPAPETPMPAMSLPGPTAAAPRTSEEPAMAFLRSVEAGSVAFDSVSPEFLRYIAKPELPSDVQRGYDEVEAKQWFARMKAKCDPPTMRAEEGGAAVYSGLLMGTSSGRYALRMVESPAGWKVDWFQRLPASATAAGNPFETFAADCALASILDPQKDRATRSVVRFLSPALLQKLGEPVFESDRQQGYNLGTLQKSLRGLVKDAKDYSLQHTDGNNYRAELTGGAAPRILSLQTIKGPGRAAWLVDEIKAE